MDLRRRILLMLAGAAGAALWAAQQPIDKRLAHRGYDDVELLGRMAHPHDGSWRPAGWAMHLANGALFGLVYSEVLRRLPAGISPRVSAQAMAQAENFGLYPLAAVLDRHHPARGHIAPAFGRRQLVQATWRHAILGVVLGEVAARTAPPADARRG